MQDHIDSKARMELCFDNVYKLQNHVIAMERANRPADFKDLNLLRLESPRDTDRGPGTCQGKLVSSQQSSPINVA